MNRRDLIAELEALKSPAYHTTEGYERWRKMLFACWWLGRDRALPWPETDYIRSKLDGTPDYTLHLHAALMLVPVGSAWELRGYPDETYRASVFCPTSEGYAQGRTPALALTIAALKAREAGT